MNRDNLADLLTVCMNRMDATLIVNRELTKVLGAHPMARITNAVEGGAGVISTIDIHYSENVNFQNCVAFATQYTPSSLYDHALLQVAKTARDMGLYILKEGRRVQGNAE